MRCLFLIPLVLMAMVLTAVDARAQVTNNATPPLLTGFGTLSVLAASLAVSTLTAAPSSPAFPMPANALPSKYLTIRNSVGSANIVYVCWFGGTCTTGNGEPIAIGETAVRNLGALTTSPTVISGGTATIVAGW